MIALRQKIYPLPILIFVLGMICSVAFLRGLLHQEQQAIGHDFARVAGDRSSVVAERLKGDLSIPENLRLLFAGTAAVQEKDFASRTAPILQRTQELEAIGWVLRETASAGRPSFPLSYLKLRDHNGLPAGFSWSDVPGLPAVIDESLRSGQRRWLNLPPERDATSQDLWLVALPVAPHFEGAETAAATGPGQGVLLMCIDLRRLLHATFDDLEKVGLDAVIYRGLPEEDRVLSRWFSATRTHPYDPVLEKGAAAYAYRRTIRLDLERWTIYCRPAPAFLARYDWWEQGFIFAGCLLASGLLAGFFQSRRVREEALRRQNAKLKLLQEVAMTANEVASVPELLSNTLQLICRYLEWPVGNVYVQDTDNPDRFISGMIWFIEDTERFAAFKTAAEAWRAEPGKGMVGRVIESGRPLFVPNIEKFDGFQCLAPALQTGLRSGFAFPVFVRQKVAGVVACFDTKMTRPFEGWQELLTGISTQMGYAMERKLAEEQLLEKNAVLENAAEGIARVDTQGIYLSVNRAYAAMCGVPVAELLGKNGREMIHPDDRPIFQAAYQRMVIEGRATAKGRRVRPDGSVYFQDLTMVRDLDHKGNVRGCHLFTRDVTEREEQQAALRESEERFVAFMDHNPASAAIKDEESRVLYINRTAQELFGLDPEAVKGQGPEELTSPEVAKIIRDSDRQLLETNQPLSLVEIIPDLKGQPRHWLVYKFPMKSRAGKRLIGVLSLDITDRKQAEEAIIRARDEALASARLKSQFLANMSHEIRTPMNGLIGMLGLMARTTLDERQNELLHLARSSADSLLRLLNDILDFSKIEAGKLELEPAVFDLRQCVRHAAKVLSVSALQKGLLLNHDVREDVPRYLIGDSGRLAQVLVNLINNGIKFTNEGLVYVSAWVEMVVGDEVLLHFAVRDTGAGVPAEKQSVIFDAFRQADSSTTRRYGGTGLGLAICMQLVALMGGRIWIESGNSEGSTFHFTARFQIAPDPAHNSEKPPALRDAGATATTSLRILLAEDNLINQRLALELLGERGHRVTVAQNGAEAVRRCREESFDVILMDIQMPVMDGFEATTGIRELPGGKDIPIIAMTAHALPEDQRHCLEVGMKACLTKPLQIDKFVDLVERQCVAVAREPSIKIAPSMSEERPVFNRGEALQRALGKEDLLLQIAELFLQHGPQDAEEMRAALGAADAARLGRASHRLRGSASSLAALPLEEILQRLETASRAGLLNDCQADWPVFEREFARICEALRSLQLVATT